MEGAGICATCGSSGLDPYGRCGRCGTGPWTSATPAAPAGAWAPEAGQETGPPAGPPTAWPAPPAWGPPPPPPPTGRDPRPDRASPALVVAVTILVVITVAVGGVVFLGTSSGDAADEVASEAAFGDDDATAEPPGAARPTTTTEPPPTTEPPTTEPPPGPSAAGRVAMEEQGFRWTMSGVPFEMEVPGLPTGTRGTAWNVPSVNGVESVQVLDVGVMSFPLDTFLFGVGLGMGGSTTEPVDAELAGLPARTAGLDGTIEGMDAMGQVIVARHGTRLIVAIVAGGLDEAFDLAPRFDELVASIAIA